MREEDKEIIKEVLAHIAASQHRRSKAKKAGVPQVGIVFVLGDRTYIDSTPVTEAEGYRDFKIHDRDHLQYWEQLQRIGAVPRNLEYDEVPRGRSVYNAKTREYALYLDPCILKDKKLVGRIMAEMNLPFEATETATDPHYRCPKCLRKSRREA